GGKAADWTQVHSEAAAGAAERVEIGLEAWLIGNEIRIGHLRSRLEDARFEARVVYVSDAAWIDERSRNGRVDVDESIEIIVRHHLVEDALKVCDPQRVIHRVG